MPADSIAVTRVTSAMSTEPAWFPFPFSMQHRSATFTEPQLTSQVPPKLPEVRYCLLSHFNWGGHKASQRAGCRGTECWVQCDVWVCSMRAERQKSATCSNSRLQPSLLTTMHSCWGRNCLLVWPKPLPAIGLLCEWDVDLCIKLWDVILHCRGEPSPFWQLARDSVTFRAWC